MTKTLMPMAALCATALLTNAAVAQPPQPPTPGIKPPPVRQVLRKMDADGDGLISYEEFTLPEKRRGAEQLEAADADGDGNISRAEMEAQLAVHIEAVKQRAEDRFTRADVNGDGFVTPEERKQVAFESLDENGDGYLSAEELAGARKRDRPPQG